MSKEYNEVILPVHWAKAGSYAKVRQHDGNYHWLKIKRVNTEGDATELLYANGECGTFDHGVLVQFLVPMEGTK